VTLPSPSPCEPWRFWATSGFALAALAAWFAAQFLAEAIAILVFTATRAGLADDAGRRLLFGLSVSIVAAPAPMAVTALAARLAGCRVIEYFALHWPRRNHLALGFALIVVLVPLGDLASYFSGRAIIPPFVVDAYRSARDANALILLALALVIVAPLTEEWLFRGFLLRGYAVSRLGSVGAVIVTSGAWASMHVQYEFFFIAQIFILGLVFGWLRLRSGSMVLTLVLHAIVNLYALAQTAFLVGRA
jgi:membrane protease YdiL (CAAX protease family)